ncbi:MAG TPA: TonB-dependent receptor plug domain-containing protein [Longimicrobiales bacterium]
MSAASGARRWRRRAGALLVFVCLSFPAILLAQDPRPPARDTLAADTLPQEEPDTVVPPAVIFPAMPLGPAASAAGTEWVWDRERLLREMALSLTDLLERVPGITVFRAGAFGQPEAASAFGGTAGRTEVVLDGYVLDPLAAATLDLAQIPLGQLREVRVQRRLGLLRIILSTEAPAQGRPYSRVEAGIGVPDANMFRGQFLVPHVIVGPLALGIERIDAEGTARSEPAGLFSGWAKWAWTNDDRGIQLEWMRNTLRREPDSPWLVDRVQQDFILRARNRFARGFVTEAYVGTGSLDETIPPPDDTTEERHVDRQSLQAGVRAGVDLPATAVTAAVRYRSEDPLPALEGVIDGETRLGPFGLGAELGAARWGGLDPISWLSVRAELGRLIGLAAFGELTRGSRAARRFADTFGDGVVLTERNGWRGGVSLDLGRAAGSVAYVRLEQEHAIPFGLPFDSAGLPGPTSPATGIEAHGRFVIWPDYLTLSSWITDWRKTPGWTWLPARSWRTALELHALPLPSGNLEIFGRAEAHMRGSTLAFDPAPVAGSSGLLTVPAFTTADAYLQIRIIDVRMFIRWEDILGPDIEELPGRVYRGPRIFYGVKWQLWN